MTGIRADSRKQEEGLNPRFLLFLQQWDGKGNRNTEFIIFINKMANSYKVARGIQRIIKQDNFTEFIARELEGNNAR